MPPTNHHFFFLTVVVALLLLYLSTEEETLLVAPPSRTPTPVYSLSHKINNDQQLWLLHQPKKTTKYFLGGWRRLRKRTDTYGMRNKKLVGLLQRLSFHLKRVETRGQISTTKLLHCAKAKKYWTGIKNGRGFGVAHQVEPNCSGSVWISRANMLDCRSKHSYCCIFCSYHFSYLHCCNI